MLATAKMNEKMPRVVLIEDMIADVVQFVHTYRKRTTTWARMLYERRLAVHSIIKF